MHGEGVLAEVLGEEEGGTAVAGMRTTFLVHTAHMFLMVCAPYKAGVAASAQNYGAPVFCARPVHGGDVVQQLETAGKDATASRLARIHGALSDVFQFVEPSELLFGCRRLHQEGQPHFVVCHCVACMGGADRGAK